MAILAEIQRRITHLNVSDEMVFSSSTRSWHDPDESAIRWWTMTSQPNPVLIGKLDGLIIDSDSCANIAAPDGGIIPITGSLNAGLETGGHHVVLVCGDVDSEGELKCTAS